MDGTWLPRIPSEPTGNAVRLSSCLRDIRVPLQTPHTWAAEIWGRCVDFAKDAFPAARQISSRCSLSVRRNSSPARICRDDHDAGMGVPGVVRESAPANPLSGATLRRWFILGAGLRLHRRRGRCDYGLRPPACRETNQAAAVYVRRLTAATKQRSGRRAERPLQTRRAIAVLGVRRGLREVPGSPMAYWLSGSMRRASARFQRWESSQRCAREW